MESYGKNPIILAGVLCIASTGLLVGLLADAWSIYPLRVALLRASLWTFMGFMAAMCGFAFTLGVEKVVKKASAPNGGTSFAKLQAITALVSLCFVVKAALAFSDEVLDGLKTEALAVQSQVPPKPNGE